jgi:RNA polymerase sigma-70 factor, ECF subfamily
MTSPPPPHRPLRLERSDARESSSMTRGVAASQEQEATLRQRIVMRDERALAELIQLTTPWLLGVAQAMLQDADDAEDVVMETFRVVWSSLARSESDAIGLMPLLLRITRQRAIDRLRHRARGRRLADALMPSAIEQDTLHPVEPNEAAAPGWHIHSHVHAALALLPAEQLTAVTLAYFDGLAQSEIATRLGVPLGTVKTRIRLALSRLRTSLAPLKDWIS